MNIYKILGFSCGMTREVTIQAYDIQSAVNMSGIMINDVIKIELIGSANTNDMT